MGQSWHWLLAGSLRQHVGGPAIRVSLLARQMSLPALMAATVGCRPAHTHDDASCRSALALNVAGQLAAARGASGTEELLVGQADVLTCLACRSQCGRGQHDVQRDCALPHSTGRGSCRHWLQAYNMIRAKASPMQSLAPAMSAQIMNCTKPQLPVASDSLGVTSISDSHSLHCE